MFSFKPSLPTFYQMRKSQLRHLPQITNKFIPPARLDFLHPHALLPALPSNNPPTYMFFFFSFWPPKLGLGGGLKSDDASP